MMGPKSHWSGCLELNKPMSTTLPHPTTKQPSRTGLSYYECLADGIIHAAVAFGIEQDENFVARVATLGWANGSAAVTKKVQHAAKVAQTLHEVLETGRSDTVALCKTIEGAVEASSCAFTAIRQHYHTTLGTQVLSAECPKDAGTIRRIVAEAVLAGLSCRGAAPKLYEAVVETLSETGGEQNFLGSMLVAWLDTNGLPTSHPFLQMAGCFYERKPRERRLIGELISPVLETALEHGGLWHHEVWMETGWKLGVNQSAYAPDTVEPLFEEAGEEHLGYCKELYRDCILPNRIAGKPMPDLAAAFEAYISRCKDSALHLPEVRKENPRLLAARAFDFAVWMGFLAGAGKP